MELLRKVGPYLAIELFMPGGTLLALLLYFARQRKKFSCFPCRFRAPPFDY